MVDSICVMCQHDEEAHDERGKFCTIQGCKCPHFTDTIEDDPAGAVIKAEHGDGGI